MWTAHQEYVGRVAVYKTCIAAQCAKPGKLWSTTSTLWARTVCARALQISVHTDHGGTCCIESAQRFVRFNLFPCREIQLPHTLCALNLVFGVPPNSGFTVRFFCISKSSVSLLSQTMQKHTIYTSELRHVHVWYMHHPYNVHITILTRVHPNLIHVFSLRSLAYHSWKYAYFNDSRM